MHGWPFHFIEWRMSFFGRAVRRIAIMESGSAPSHLNQTTHTAYDAEGRVTQTWGATYPVAYDYDEFDRMIALHTWRDENGDPDTTQWLYNDATGLLFQKLYADNKGPSYTYTPDGQLATRIWARGITTDYTYDNSGNLTNIDYSDTTPSVAFSYDRMGRQLSVSVDGVVTNLYAYSLLGQLTAETTITADTTSTLTRSYDDLGRPTGHSLGAPGVSPEYAVTYGYDTFGRFSTLTTHSPSLSTVNSSLLTTYSYLPGTDLISGLAYDTIGHQWTRTYEPSRNLIASVQTHHNSTLLASYDYANDAIGRRTSIARSGSLYDAPVIDVYGYNEKSEVTSSRRYLHHSSFIPPHSEEVPGFAYDYAYDAIGNRITATEYDHENQALISAYTANELNQYESRTVPGYAAVRGVSDPGTFVTVNDNPATQVPSSCGAPSHFYGGNYVDNTQGSVLHPLSITAALPANAPQQLLTVNSSLSTEPDLTTTETGSLFISQTPELFTYDDDGNMTSDGRFSYTWDAENRLIRAETLPDISTLYTLHSTLSNASPVRVEYAYDHRYRRIAKHVFTLDNQSWTPSESRCFVYDRWNLARENVSSHHSTPSIIIYYTWGLDLNGRRRAAGGVGGLQFVTDDNDVYFPIYDVNGNINGYASVSSTLVARYEYSPFGKTLFKFGKLSDIFTFRFSTKNYDSEIDLYNYGYRPYSPSIGKWISRDLLSERGGINLYNFCINNSINKIDYLGYMPIPWGGGGLPDPPKNPPDFIFEDEKEELPILPPWLDIFDLDEDMDFFDDDDYDDDDDDDIFCLCAEHTKNKRKSTSDKHSKPHPSRKGRGHKAKKKPGWIDKSTGEVVKYTCVTGGILVTAYAINHCPATWTNPWTACLGSAAVVVIIFIPIEEEPCCEDE